MRPAWRGCHTRCRRKSQAQGAHTPVPRPVPVPGRDLRPRARFARIPSRGRSPVPVPVLTKSGTRPQYSPHHVHPRGPKGWVTKLKSHQTPHRNRLSSFVAEFRNNREGPPGWAEHPLRTGGSEIKLNGEYLNGEKFVTGRRATHAWRHGLRRRRPSDPHATISSCSSTSRTSACLQRCCRGGLRPQHR
jgi:hypothetical protein